MNPDEELQLRLRMKFFEERQQFLVQVISRLLKHVRLPEGVSAKTYSNKEVRTIQVPSRALATALRIVRESKN